MLFTVLLFVLAELLFGLSSVLGALGWISGTGVALIAVVWTGISLGFTPEVWILIGLWAAALIGVAYYNASRARDLVCRRDCVDRFKAASRITD